MLGQCVPPCRREREGGRRRNLLKNCVRERSRHSQIQVAIRGAADRAVNPPEECVYFHKMHDFVSQIAPVPYSSKFTYRDRLVAAAKEYGIPIDEVNVTIADGNKKPVAVTKPYTDKYSVGSAEVRLQGCEIIGASSHKWWGWVGKKRESGPVTMTHELAVFV